VPWQCRHALPRVDKNHDFFNQKIGIFGVKSDFFISIKIF